MNEKSYTNLRIISKIKINDKISFNNDNFVIVKNNNWLLGIIRSLYREDRSKNISQLKEIYNDIFIYINIQLSSKYIENSEKLSSLEYETHLKLCFDLNHISNELLESKIGINNLKKTYNNDTLIDSQLDTINNNIDNIIKEIKNKIIESAIYDKDL